MSDYIRQLGSAAFGTRLRRLSERLDRDVQAMYRERGIRFEPRWFAVVSALDAQRTLSVGDLADQIGVTHAAISQWRAELIAAGLVRTRADPVDQRRLLVELTPQGKRTVTRLRPFWQAIAAATTLLLAEAAPGFIDALDHIEQALDAHSLADRVDAARGHEPTLAGASHEGD